MQYSERLQITHITPDGTEHVEVLEDGITQEKAEEVYLEQWRYLEPGAFLYLDRVMTVRLSQGSKAPRPKPDLR